MILETLASGLTFDQILDCYPHISAADIRACLNYAKTLVRKKRAAPVALSVE